MCAQNRAPATRSAGRQMSVFESSCSGRRSLRAAAPGLFETSKHERRVFIITNDGDDLRYSAHAAVLGKKKDLRECVAGGYWGQKLHNYVAVFTLYPETVTRVAPLRSVSERRKQTALSAWAGEDNRGLLHNSSDVLLQMITYEYDDEATVWGPMGAPSWQGESHTEWAEHSD